MFLFFIGFIVIILSVLFQSRNYRWFYILYKTYRRDVKGAIRFFRLNTALKHCSKRDSTICKIFTQNVDKHPNKIGFYIEDKQWTFKQLDEYSNQVAHYFKSKNFKRGDCVALLLENKPEYACIWLGLAKIGVVTSLINTNLVSQPLVHSINVCNAKAIIFDDVFKKVIDDIRDKLENFQFFQFEAKEHLLEGAVDLNSELQQQPKSRLMDDIKKGKLHDPVLFIYTSGTTGLPKAAVITNMRFLMMSISIRIMTCVTENDVWYGALPLYHSAGGIVTVGHCLIIGGTSVLRKKFSASAFWTECIKYKCTVAQYIGEICRFILAAHSKNAGPVQHSVKKMIGNGLRPQIWKEFKEKFMIEDIYEFYGSTEGNSNLINIDNVIGSIGFVPRYAVGLYPVTLVRCNEFTGEPIRGPDGFCMRCQPGEVGVFIGHVKKSNALNEFRGYADKEATKKKMLSDVFKKGDLFFNSGDILVMDELGNYYFRDRTGDTYRWKGENVATSEIEAIISNFANLTDATVYGVEIPGNEGRAGMVAIVDEKNQLDFSSLARKLKDNLPAYAVPIFLRVMNSLPMTGTFKLKKMDLQAEGYNLNKIKDKLYMYDPKNVTYVELTKDTYETIQSGNLRV